MSDPDCWSILGILELLRWCLKPLLLKTEIILCHQTLKALKYFYINQKTKIFFSSSTPDKLIWKPVLWVYCRYKYVTFPVRGSTLDVRIWRLKSVPALAGGQSNFGRKIPLQLKKFWISPCIAIKMYSQVLLLQSVNKISLNNTIQNMSSNGGCYGINWLVVMKVSAPPPSAHPGGSLVTWATRQPTHLPPRLSGTLS